MSEAGSYFLRVEDLLFPGTITLLSGFQLAHFAKRVGATRMKLKIPFPATTGDPAFDRAFRAQMNTLEFHPIFLSCLWVSSIFFHPGVAAALGVVYIYSRHRYFEGYCESIKGRLPGFYMGIKCLQVYLLIGLSGLVTVALRKYAGIDLSGMASSYLPTALQWK